MAIRLERPYKFDCWASNKGVNDKYSQKKKLRMLRWVVTMQKKMVSNWRISMKLKAASMKHDTSKYSSNEKLKMWRWLSDNAQVDGKQLANLTDVKDGIFNAKSISYPYQTCVGH